jgi:hypothetical protein
MMDFQGEGVLVEFETVFGHKPTISQLQFLVKLSKHVRGRCRSNIAFNNYMNRTFGSVARFRSVTKQGPMGPYEGLEIVVR